MIDAGNTEILTVEDGKILHPTSSYRMKSFMERFPYFSQANIENEILFPQVTFPVSKSSFSTVSSAVNNLGSATGNSLGQRNAYNDYGRTFNGQMVYKTMPVVGNPSAGPNHLCPVCEKTFRASSLLDIHMRVHVGAKPFVCPVCGHRATQKGNLKLHMKKHHGADLPPHIDIVPDSGIWGHPRENQLVLGPLLSPDSGLDELSGKRRQVAQAVSSMLDEEIVELIKKCQNNVGQGMTGRITESLEDFIHIAKSKSVEEIGRDSCGSTGRNSVSPSASCQKIRHNRNNFKFVPYVPKKKSIQEGWNDREQHPSSSRDSNSLSLKNLARSLTLVNMSSERGLMKSEITVKREYKNSYDNFVDIGRIGTDITKTLEISKEGKSEPADDCESFRTLPEGDKSIEITDKKLCELSSYIDEAQVEDNATSSPDEMDEKTSKVDFMIYLGLTSINSPHPANRGEHGSGLNPFLDYMTRKLCLEEADAFPIPSSRNKSQWLNTRKRLSDVTVENIEKVPSCKRGSVNKEIYNTNSGQRASPSVLNMLRQTVLNSVEHKLAQPSAPHADCNYIEITENSKLSSEQLDSLNKIDQPYRNLAMQSLANIGKSMLSLEESQEKKIELGERKSPNALLRNYNELNPANIKGNLHSILLNLQEQSNSGYQCCFCPKWFKYRSVLDIHMRSHTGERPYKCPYCEYAGTQHNCLKLHIQRHHPREYMLNHADTLGNKGPGLSISSSPPNLSSMSGATDSSSYRVSCFSPVNCPICGRVSPSPGYLKIHMRSHKKSLDHVCHICGRGFKEYWYLSTHLKTHERELRSMRHNTKSDQPMNPLLFFPNEAGTHSARLLDEMRKLNGACPDFFRGDVLNSGLLKDSMKLLKESSPAVNSFATSNRNNSNKNQGLPSSVNFVKADSVSPSDFSMKKSGPMSHNSDEYDAKSTQNGVVDCEPVATVPHFSRRKATCPSKISSEPYPKVTSALYGDEEDTTLYKRKCKPRKVYHGTYLTPPLSRISFGRKETRDDRMNEKFTLPYSKHTTEHSYDDELPLDLSCTQKEKRENTLPCRSDKNNNVDDTPLNLSKI